MTTLTAPQTLAAGVPAIGKGTAFLGGVSNVPIIPPLDTLMGCILGHSGSGKSALMQSNPGCFIINTEVAGTSCPRPRALTWPVRDSKGFPAESASDGAVDPILGVPLRKIILTWDHAKNKIAEIIKARQDNLPGAPSCICLDSVAGSMKMLQDWVVKHSVRLGITRDAVDNFDKMDGRAAWDAAYSELLNVGLEARNNGVGFWYVIHLADKMVMHTGALERTKETGFIITDNLWCRLMPWFEMIGAIVIDNRSVAEVTPGIKIPDGKGGFTQGPPTTRNITKQVRVAQFTSQDPSGVLQQALKRRGVKMPDKIDLPEVDAWDLVASLYQKAATPSP